MHIIFGTIGVAVLVWVLLKQERDAKASGYWPMSKSQRKRANRAACEGKSYHPQLRRYGKPAIRRRR